MIHFFSSWWSPIPESTWQTIIFNLWSFLKNESISNSCVQKRIEYCQYFFYPESSLKFVLFDDLILKLCCINSTGTFHVQL
ncbi:hypothetical protein TNCT_666921 [Trichonephila clavata]|uniref:Uncharacterized protein n=1 Tax=Trichonephila clavata TaxID=2740835 RepID=A0A8X6LDF1_TRICU|nr:hypothetical protein TNCT_666921 [Trichonephila clavata]